MYYEWVDLDHTKNLESSSTGKSMHCFKLCKNNEILFGTYHQVGNFSVNIPVKLDAIKHSVLIQPIREKKNRKPRRTNYGVCGRL